MMALSKIDPAGLDIGQIGGRRNLIINGAMQVAQRGDSTGISSTGYYGPDRFRTAANRDELTWDVEQSSDAPSGFASSFKITVNTPDSALSAQNQFNIQYRMEGQDLQQLKKGTASAESVTLSFWVKCSLTGTWTASLLDTDNDRIIQKNFTIDSANTWEHKTFTFVGDTTGALTNDNNDSLRFRIYLDAGTVYTSGTVTEDTWQTPVTTNLVETATGFMTTDAATFQITGVQLEVGDTATPFEHRSYGEELALCQRYFNFFPSLTSSSGASAIPIWTNNTSSGSTRVTVPGPRMRATPSATVFGTGADTGTTPIIGSGGTIGVYMGAFGDAPGLTATEPTADPSIRLNVNSSSGLLSKGAAGLYLYCDANTGPGDSGWAGITLDAEL